MEYKAKVIANSGKTVNMRSNASTSSGIIMAIQLGSIVEVSENSGEWSKIIYNDKVGYMMSKFLEKVPVSEPEK